MAEPGGPEDVAVRPFARLGHELRQARERNDVSLRKLARELYTSHPNLHDYELGFRLAPEQIVEGYETKLDLDSGSLLRLRQEVASAHAHRPSTPRPAVAGAGQEPVPTASGRRRRWLIVLAPVLVLVVSFAGAVWMRVPPEVGTSSALPDDPPGQWVPGRGADATRFHCSQYVQVAASNGARVRMQTCILLAKDERGAAYRGLIGVENLSDETAKFKGNVSATVDGIQEPAVGCGNVDLLPRTRQWCFSETKRVAPGHSLRSQALLESDINDGMTQSPTQVS